VELSGTKSALKASRLLFLLASKGKEREKNIEYRTPNNKFRSKNFTKILVSFNKNRLQVFQYGIYS
jgi:hypothetical protein